MATALTPQQVYQQIRDPQGRRLFQLWRKLPDGPMTEDALDVAIIRAAGLYELDTAGAHAYRSSLLNVRQPDGSERALIARRGEDGALLYEKGTVFPLLEDGGPGSARFNAQLARQAEEEEELQREEDRAIRDNMASSPFGVHRRELLALIDERVDNRIEQLAEDLDGSAVEQLREALHKRRTEAVTA